MPLVEQSSSLKITTLEIISKETENGVLIQMSSPDPDGKKMSNMFANLFTDLTGLLKSQGVTIKSSHLDINGNRIRQ